MRRRAPAGTGEFSKEEEEKEEWRAPPRARLCHVTNTGCCALLQSPQDEEK